MTVRESEQVSHSRLPRLACLTSPAFQQCCRPIWSSRASPLPLRSELDPPTQTKEKLAPRAQSYRPLTLSGIIRSAPRSRILSISATLSQILALSAELRPKMQAVPESRQQTFEEIYGPPENFLEIEVRQARFSPAQFPPPHPP